MTLLINRTLDLRRDVGGELDDLGDATGAVENRAVGCLDPDHAAIFGNALELVGLRLTPVQRIPERAIGGRVALRRSYEVAVVLALQLAKRVADKVEEVGVGFQNGAVGGERDASMRTIDAVEQRTQRGSEQTHRQVPNQRIISVYFNKYI